MRNLALVDHPVNHLLDGLFIHVDLKIHLLIRDVVGHDGVEENLVISRVDVLDIQVVDIEDVLQVVEDVDHVVAVRSENRSNLSAIHVDQFLAIVDHDIPGFQVRPGQKKGCVSRQNMNCQLSPGSSHTNWGVGTEVRPHCDAISKPEIARIFVDLSLHASHVEVAGDFVPCGLSTDSSCCTTVHDGPSNLL